MTPFATKIIGRQLLKRCPNRVPRLHPTERASHLVHKVSDVGVSEKQAHVFFLQPAKEDTVAHVCLLEDGWALFADGCVSATNLFCLNPSASCAGHGKKEALWKQAKLNRCSGSVGLR